MKKAIPAIKIKTKKIQQKVVFNAPAMAVYEALMDSKKHSQFSGGKAKMSAKVGGKFTAYDGYIEGKNLELKPGKKIVQTWHASDWVKGYYSTVTFVFTEKKGKTTLVFTHEGVPAEQYQDIKQGWEDYYWVPMKKLFGK